MPNLVPMVVERTSEGERSMDIFSRLGRDRVIIIDQDFNPTMAATVCAQLMVMDSEETKPIQLHLNTPGGEIYSLMQIFATIDKIESEVHTYCLGLAASCGSALFNYATPGKRFISKWGTQMIHQPSSGTQGKITDQQNALQEGIRLKKVLTDLYVDKCTAKLSRKQIEDLMERDKWLDAEESVRLGFADHII